MNRIDLQWEDRLFRRDRLFYRLNDGVPVMRRPAEVECCGHVTSITSILQPSWSAWFRSPIWTIRFMENFFTYMLSFRVPGLTLSLHGLCQMHVCFHVHLGCMFPTGREKRVGCASFKEKIKSSSDIELVCSGFKAINTHCWAFRSYEDSFCSSGKWSAGWKRSTVKDFDMIPSRLIRFAW